MNEDNTVAPARESQVGIALNSLEQVIEHADKAAQFLCGRIETVLTTNSSPREIENIKVEEDCVVQLAGRIAKAAASIEKIAIYIEDTRKRVEL